MQRIVVYILERAVDIFNWAKINKFKASVYIIGSFVFLQYLSLPNNSLQALRKTKPIPTALMQQRIDEAKSDGKIFSITQRWIPLSKISPNLIHAVIVSEDGTFYSHEGVDWYEVEESIVKNIKKGKSVRGGSTISQQLAKNLYLSTSKDFLRKFKELIITLRMERTLSKRRILEIYLNIIEWGDGIFGAEAAAQKYFKKSALNLTREEAALMAAVIPSPRKHRPDFPTKYIQNRSSIILERMAARGY